MKGKWANNLFKQTGILNYKGWMTEIGNNHSSALYEQTAFAISPDEKFVIVPRGTNLWLYYLAGNVAPRMFLSPILPLEICVCRPWNADGQLFAIGCATGDGCFRTFILDFAAPKDSTRNDDSDEGGALRNCEAGVLAPTGSGKRPVVCRYISHPSPNAEKRGTQRTLTRKSTRKLGISPTSSSSAPAVISHCEVEEHPVVLLWADDDLFAIIEFTFHNPRDDDSPPASDTLAIVPAGNLKQSGNEGGLLAGDVVSAMTKETGEESVLLVKARERMVISRDWNLTLNMPPPTDLSIGATTSDLALKMVKKHPYLVW